MQKNLPLKNLSRLVALALAAATTPWLLANAGNSSACKTDFALIEALPDLVAKRKAWDPSRFTEPSHHNDKEFRYIVHAGPHVAGKEEDAAQAFFAHTSEADLNEEGFFSASVISEGHTSTFNRFGLILSVPKEKIVAATPDDMRSHLGELQKTLTPDAITAQLFHQHSLPSPEEILKAAKPGRIPLGFDMSWTEVVINGRGPSPNALKISGVFVHKDSLGRPLLTDSRLAISEAAAQKLGVPLVKIPPSSQITLAVDMERVDRKTKAYGRWGPSQINFLATEKDVKRVFAQAKSAGKKVLLVDRSNGPATIAAGPQFFEGSWETEKLVEKGKTPFGSPIYESVYTDLMPAEQPPDLAPVKFTFTSP